MLIFGYMKEFEGYMVPLGVQVSMIPVSQRHTTRLIRKFVSRFALPTLITI